MRRNQYFFYSLFCSSSSRRHIISFSFSFSFNWPHEFWAKYCHSYKFLNLPWIPFCIYPKYVIRLLLLLYLLFPSWMKQWMRSSYAISPQSDDISDTVTDPVLFWDHSLQLTSVSNLKNLVGSGLKFSSVFVICYTERETAWRCDFAGRTVTNCHTTSDHII